MVAGGKRAIGTQVGMLGTNHSDRRHAGAAFGPRLLAEVSAYRRRDAGHIGGGADTRAGVGPASAILAVGAVLACADGCHEAVVGRDGGDVCVAGVVAGVVVGVLRRGPAAGEGGGGGEWAVGGGGHKGRGMRKAGKKEGRGEGAGGGEKREKREEEERERDARQDRAQTGVNMRRASSILRRLVLSFSVELTDGTSLSSRSLRPRSGQTPVPATPTPAQHRFGIQFRPGAAHARPPASITRPDRPRILDYRQPLESPPRVI